MRTSIQASGTATTHQILAGDAEVHRALAELRGDFRRRQVNDLDAVEILDGAAIVARATRLDEFKPRARKERFRILLQAALRRHGKNERGGAHDLPPLPASSSIDAAKPTAGIASRAPSRVNRAS